MKRMIEINKIYQMDCLEGMKLIQDKSVDAIITDPPYFIPTMQDDTKKNNTIREGKRNPIIKADFDKFKDLDAFKKFISDILIQFKRILKDKGQVYLFCSYHHIGWIIESIKDHGFRYYKPLIWYKPDTMGVFPNQYGCNYEPILWFRARGEEGEVKLHIGCGQRDVFTHYSTNNADRKEAGYHPTPKPLKIIQKLMKNCTNEGDLVLDPFMGSGTTAVAAKNTGRKFIGFELKPEYIQIAEKRLAQKNLNILEVFEDGIEGKSDGNNERQGESPPERVLPQNRDNESSGPELCQYDDK